MTDGQTETTALDHFLDLAQQGICNPGCSSGERAAAAIAKAVLEYACRLDGHARQGLLEFLDFADHSPMSAADLLR